jgi:carbamoyltransferase
MRDVILSSGAFFAPWTGEKHISRKLYYEMKKVFTRSRRQKIRQALERDFHYNGTISFIDHHLSHCASAYFTSGLNSATVISLDGAGDGCSSQVYRVHEGRFELLNTIDSYDSIGNYYSYVTHLCGFKAHKHEGKITGLAAYGKQHYVSLLRNYLSYEAGKIKNTGKCFDWSAIKKLQRALGDTFSKEDLAASMQYVLEELCTRYVDYWVRRSAIADVALAGGVCANVKLNQRLHELSTVRSLFIHPGMGDEGLATGAALFTCFQLCRETHTPFAWGGIDHIYWGAECSEAEIERALRAAAYAYEYHPNIEAQIARLLAAGKIVARCTGRMEYGPRALGNRSILYQTIDPTVNHWLNKKLHRTEFMPFAPVTLYEYANQCYTHIQGAEIPARFMTITLDCTEWMKKHCPAVVHVDGTARPQLIKSDTNPRYYTIIDEYRKLTGLPSIINTSFNMHEEPIVCTADDALRAFRASELDYLALQRFLVKNQAAVTGKPA